jgi:hypothetical protein
LDSGWNRLLGQSMSSLLITSNTLQKIDERTAAMANDNKIARRRWGKHWQTANYLLVGAILAFLLWEALRQAV